LQELGGRNRRLSLIQPGAYEDSYESLRTFVGIDPLFETRVRREMVSETVGVLLDWDATRREASRRRPAVPIEDLRPLEQGRVRP
jgi:hypothetical protein